MIDKINIVKIIFDKSKNIMEKNLRKVKFPNFISGKVMGIKTMKLTTKTVMTEPKIFERKILFRLIGRGNNNSRSLE